MIVSVSEPRQNFLASAILRYFSEFLMDGLDSYNTHVPPYCTVFCLTLSLSTQHCSFIGSTYAFSCQGLLRMPCLPPPGS